MRKPKISIIGAGHVGATTAHLIALKGLADIVLLDIEEGVAKGKALDMLQAGPIEKFDVGIRGTGSYEDTKNSDIVVITAGIIRKPGMSRDDLLSINTKIVKEVAERSAKHSPNAIMIVVTNPLDAMTYVASKAGKMPKNKVIGMGNILDSARFKTFIAEELNISPAKIDATVIGSHGNFMVPLPAHSKANNIKITELLSREKINDIIERTKKGGEEILELLKTGSAFYAPASSIVLMIEAILNDKKLLLPCSAYCENEYNVGGCFIGVPVILGKNGVDKIVELSLSKEENEAFIKSLESVKELNSRAEESL